MPTVTDSTTLTVTIAGAVAVLAMVGRVAWMMSGVASKVDRVEKHVHDMRNLMTVQHGEHGLKLESHHDRIMRLEFQSGSAASTSGAFTTPT